MTRESEIDRAQDSPAGAREMSAARLAVAASSALESALYSSGMTQRELAEVLGVTESAVSQVLNGDGNLRLATLARYLRAMGCEAHIDLVPAGPEGPSLPARRGPRAEPAEVAPNFAVWHTVHHLGRVQLGRPVVVREGVAAQPDEFSIYVGNQVDWSPARVAWGLPISGDREYGTSGDDLQREFDELVGYTGD